MDLDGNYEVKCMASLYFIVFIVHYCEEGNMHQLLNQRIVAMTGQDVNINGVLPS